jgi:hypothetical protein
VDVTGAINRTRAYVADGDAAGLVQITVYREDARALLEALERALAAHKVLTEQYTLSLREVADQWKNERDALREAVEYVIDCDDSKWVQYFKDELAAIDRGVSDAS